MDCTVAHPLSKTENGGMRVPDWSRSGSRYRRGRMSAHHVEPKLTTDRTRGFDVRGTDRRRLVPRDHLGVRFDHLLRVWMLADR